MLGHKERDQLELFITGSLRQLIPDEHVLARVDRVLDLSWLRQEVANCYCLDDGRPGIDPEVAVRLMLAGLLTGIAHDRKLMREAQVNVAIRWFIGYGLHEELPDHSTLTRIRQRWGEERFRKIFKRTVEACLRAKIVTGEIVHIDASLIRANVSWESLVERHVEDVLSDNRTDEEIDVERKGRQSGKFKKVCTTDPDATMATNARNRRLEPAYKQHTAVDDKVGVILDVEVTTGQTNEGEMIEPQVDEVKATTGVDIKTVTADAGYAYAKVYGALERRDIDALIPAKAEPIRSRVPLRRFRYDAKHDILKCPTGRILRPTRPIKHGRFPLCLSRRRLSRWPARHRPQLVATAANNLLGSKKVPGDIAKVSEGNLICLGPYLTNGHSGGHPAFVPTPSERRFVQAMAGLRMSTDEICKVIGSGRNCSPGSENGRPIAKTTLYRHFKNELASGRAMLKARVAGKFYNALDNDEP